MRFKEIPAVEQRFEQTQNGGNHILKPFQVPIPGQTSPSHLPITWVGRKDGFRGFFVDEDDTPKEKIVLHFTVGVLSGDISTLTPGPPPGYPQKKNRLSTNYVLARNGAIYQLFPSSKWAFHLGLTATGGNTHNSSRSIAVEISNYGPLTLHRDGKHLEDVYSTKDKPRFYCSLEDTAQYIKLPEPYRGYEYYTAYTDEQYQNLVLLLRYLTALHDIPREFLPEPARYQNGQEEAAFKGIVSHVNFRDDKFDIGPAFDWDRLIAGVQAKPSEGAAAAGAAAAVGAAMAGMGSQATGPTPNLPVFEDDIKADEAFAPQRRSRASSPLANAPESQRIGNPYPDAAFDVEW